MTTTILRIDASARKTGSVTRALADRIIDGFGAADITHRDLTDALPQITEAWVGANFTKPDDRTDAQRAALAQSDGLIAELQSADTIVIGMPVYNFGIPAALKAWIDLVARAGVTFRYTESGPEGLLKGKRAIIAAASGGVPIGSPADHATPYLRQVLGFIGIKDVEILTQADFAEPALAA